MQLVGLTAGLLQNMICCSAASIRPALLVVIINIYVRAEDIIYTFHLKETQHHHQLAKFPSGMR